MYSFDFPTGKRSKEKGEREREKEETGDELTQFGPPLLSSEFQCFPLREIGGGANSFYGEPC